MTATTPATPLNFDQLADLLVSEQIREASPSLLHGFACGGLACGARFTPATWLAAAADLVAQSAFAQPDSQAVLTALYQQSLQQFQDMTLQLTLLLPEEDTELALRVAALGQWCQGFIDGFALHGRQTDQSLSSQAREGLGDLAKIAQVASDVEEDDEHEADLMQLEEYVKVVALTLFSECNQTANTQTTQPEQLH